MSKMKELYTDLYLQNIDAGYSEEQAHGIVSELLRDGSDTWIDSNSLETENGTMWWQHKVENGTHLTRAIHADGKRWAGIDGVWRKAVVA